MGFYSLGPLPSPAWAQGEVLCDNVLSPPDNAALRSTSLPIFDPSSCGGLVSSPQSGTTRASIPDPMWPAPLTNAVADRDGRNKPSIMTLYTLIVFKRLTSVQEEGKNQAAQVLESWNVHDKEDLSLRWWQMHFSSLARTLGEKQRPERANSEQPRQNLEQLRQR
ncbi:hypothetical protein E2562_000287 [Oryza meyeriana var. granulata]|uniref:Uncharacterized protein n=1 Tax=Oryza meyeriana var. granulata TaxID=110450 RepID=A0A6G1CMP0_9ORYZ|nr:hypothetical protein E2562_000287 [Oryza meyeriana var. granulata]